MPNAVRRFRATGLRRSLARVLAQEIAQEHRERPRPSCTLTSARLNDDLSSHIVAPCARAILSRFAQARACVVDAAQPRETDARETPDFGGEVAVVMRGLEVHRLRQACLGCREIATSPLMPLLASTAAAISASPLIGFPACATAHPCTRPFQASVCTDPD
jgi:hypothetical protein